MAGYMVIIYVAIIFEKYLLTIMGFLAFKVLIPVGMGMQAVRNILGKEKDSALHKLSLRLMLLGILFWLLVPTSAIVTNMINDTYQESKAVGYEILEDTGIDEDDVAALEEEMSETEADSGDGESKSIFAVGEALGSLADKIGGTAKSVGKAASDKIDQFQNALNQLIEAVAVMIVTTCVIPIAVLIAFILIMNAVMGLSVPIPTALPKASKLIKRKSDSEISESSD